MRLPIFQSDLKEMSLMQTQWASMINPVINTAIVQGNYLNNVALIVGPNSINHLLGRNYQGWILTGMHNAYLQIYDTPSTMPDKTLVLQSSGVGIVSLYVF